MKTSVKRIIFVLAVVVITSMMIFALAACGNKNAQNNVSSNPGEKRIPVYQGMTIENSGAASSISAYTAVEERADVAYTADDDKHKDNGNHYGWYKDKEVDQDDPFEEGEDVEDAVDDSLKVDGAAQSIYYAVQNADIYITIHIDNPDSFEIMSFTLNGEKYSSYMFEKGSNMENIILKKNVGDASGIVVYTIDAIKYIDGTEIKDVLIDGDKTVRAGIKVPNQVTATVSETAGFDEISLDINVKDRDGLIDYSEGSLKAVLYDGESLIEEKPIEVGISNVKFDGLELASLYQYAIVACYDDLEAGKDWHVLCKKAVYTETAVIFDDVNVTKQGISFGFLWHDDAPATEIATLRLIDNGKEQKLDAAQTAIDNLYSNHDYTLAATYLFKGEETEIKYDFHTLAYTAPVVEVKAGTSRQEKLSFELNVTDQDQVGRVSKIELLDGTSVKTTLEDNDVREFSELLSDHAYAVRVTYTYDLKDGAGAQTIVKTLDMRTLAKATPNVSLTTDDIGQEGFAYTVTVKDDDHVGSITKAELLLDGELEDTLENAATGTLTGLYSNRNYTVRVTYTYDLNNGAGSQTTTATVDAHTQSKATPNVSLTTDDIGQEGFAYTVTVKDDDHVGSITKAELLLDGELEDTLENAATGTLTGLYSNRNYTVRVTYTYDLNNGAGSQTTTATVDAHTQSKATPDITISTSDPTQDGFSYAITETDTDGIGEITKVELWHKDKMEQDIKTATSNTLTELLSNNSYIIKVTYRYNLNEGNADVIVEKESTISTLEKATPCIEIVDVTRTTDSLSFDIDEQDADEVGEIVRYELLQGEDVEFTHEGAENKTFGGLQSYTLYTIKVTYSYDLNEGEGSQEICEEVSVHTVPLFEATKTECINTGAVLEGATMTLQIDVDNPSKAQVSEVKVNGIWYPVNGTTTTSNIRVTITNEGQFRGGWTDLTAEEMRATIGDEEFTFALTANNVAKCFINGNIEVLALQVVDVDGNELEYAYEGDTVYLQLTFDNPTGYKIDRFTIYSNYNDEIYNGEEIITINVNTIRVIAKTLSKNYELLNFAYSIGNVNKEKGTENIYTQLAVLSTTEEVEIRTANQLKHMNEGKRYKLMNDIDLLGEDWSIPGDFDGYFDGNNFTIRNMRVVDDFENQKMKLGLFKSAKGIIKNLNIEGVLIIANIKGGQCYYGGVAADADHLSIKNVYVSGSISITSDSDISAGGIIGFNDEYFTIIGCSNASSISISAPDLRGDVGGICGFTNKELIIINCYNTGALSGGAYTGGIVGNGIGCIKNCYNTGTINSKYYAGGIIGNVLLGDKYTVNNSFYIAEGEYLNFVGGYFGNLEEFTNCYHFSDGTLGVRVNSKEKLIAKMRAILDGDVWDFKNTTDDGFPTLKAFAKAGE